MLKLGICLFILLVINNLQLNVKCQNATLKELAKAHNRYFGYAANSNYLINEPDYVMVADREFDCLTPEGDMKWNNIEGVKGKLTFHNSELIVNHARTHGQKIRGHALIWHEQIPKWLSDGHFNATQFESLMKAHITSEVERFKGQIYAWDVINEMFRQDGTLRTNSSLFSRTLGNRYIAEAFRYAHAADPVAKLYYNDYDAEGINHKSDAIYHLVKELKSQQVPIHGIGFQAHFRLGHVPVDIRQNLERFVALDLDVAITELDIRIHKPVDAAKLAQQGKEYAQVVQACLAVSRCVGITTWGLTDRHSWIAKYAPDYDSALLFDRDYKHKPAYTAVIQVLSQK